MPNQTLQRSPETPTESTDDGGPEPTEIPLDVVFDLLSNERRRHVLRYLHTESSSTTLGDLAEYIAAIENDKPESALSSTERKRVYISLYQSHLPKMSSADVIDFDVDRKTVELAENAEYLMRFLPEQVDSRAGERSDGLFSGISTVAKQVSDRLLNSR